MLEYELQVAIILSMSGVNQATLAGGGLLRVRQLGQVMTSSLGSTHIPALGLQPFSVCETLWQPEHATISDAVCEG